MWKGLTRTQVIVPGIKPEGVQIEHYQITHENQISKVCLTLSNEQTWISSLGLQSYISPLVNIFDGDFRAYWREVKKWKKPQKKGKHLFYVGSLWIF